MKNPIIEYVTNRMKRQSTPFTIINGFGFYVVNGWLVPERKFNRQYPLRARLSFKKDIDTRRFWNGDILM